MGSADRGYKQRDQSNSGPRGEEGRKEDSWGMWLCHERSDLWSPVQDRSWPRVWHLACDHMIALQVMERPCDSQSP